MMRRRLTAKRGASGPGRSAPAGSRLQSSSVEKNSLVTVDLSPISVKASTFVRLLLVTLTSMLLHLAGMYLFASGFLLTRLELDTRSSCSTYDLNHISQQPLSSASPGQGCWHKPRYDRAVLVILDALRFDFTVYDEELEAEVARTGDNSSVPFYINKLPVLHDVVKSQPANGLLFRVRADPPTTTLQRLKALTTGTLPTFVDAGSNFFGQVIGEDNIIEQFSRAGKRVVFMGDDTWESMYPNAMNESYPYPSLEVWDLHTVDNGILEHLSPTLTRTPKNWDLVIAHFLGVDHAGHRYGPAHPAMGNKLSQMNSVLESIFKDVDEDTVVFVIGDHGMDSKGDHGGESENEINAGLFIYSKRPLIDADNAALADILHSMDSLDFGSNDPFVFMDGHRTVPQIDFVPTISLLLGIPIPFGNLGTVIPEVFFVPETSSAEVPARQDRNLLEAMRANARQIHTYIMEYSQQRMAAKMAISELNAIFDDAEDNYAELANTADAEIDTIKEVYLQYVKYTRRALVAARKLWARFDIPLIVLGCAVLGLAFSTLVVYGLMHLNAKEEPMYAVIIVGTALGFIVAVTGVAHPVLAKFEHSGDSALSLPHEVVFGTAAGFTLSYLVSSFFQWCRPDTSVSASGWSRKTLFALLLLILHVAIPASDSFTIHEDSITVYLLQTFGFISLLWAFAVDRDEARDKLVIYTLIFMVLTRVSQFSTICREEQHPYCIPTFNSSPHASVASPNTVVLLYLMIPIVALSLRRSLRSSDNDQGIGKIIPNLFLPVGLFISATYWCLDTLDNQAMETPSSWDFAFIKYWWARFGFLLIGSVCLFLWTSDADCLGIDLIHDTTVNAQGVPQNGERVKSVCFLGIPNAIGGSYLVFLSIIYMILTMFQKPMGGLMLGIAFIQLLCLLEMFHIWRDKTTVSRDEERKAVPDASSSIDPAQTRGTHDPSKRDKGVTMLFLVAVYLLSSRYYFATGHQATLSSIQWDVGYVGLKQLSWSISPLLVILNTFAAPLLFGLASPLFALWKRPLIRGTERRMGIELANALILYLAMISAATVAATLLAGHFRRHLMVWRVFAPKFFFSAMVMFLVDVVLVVIGMAAVWRPVQGYRNFLLKMKQLRVIR